jgi:hypothetical protein
MSEIPATTETASASMPRRILFVVYVVAAYALCVYVLAAFISIALKALSYIDWSLALPPAGVWILLYLVSRCFPMNSPERKDKAAA